MHWNLDDILVHYGTPRHSGRYPWGSGDEPYQHSLNFMSRVDECRKQGMSQVEIARSMGMKTTEYRKQISLANATINAKRMQVVTKLREKGYSPTAIEKKTGIKESTVRSMLKSQAAVRGDAATKNAETLKTIMKDKPYLDIGAGAEHQLGISKVQLNNAVSRLESEGYVRHKVPVIQAGTGKQINVVALCPPGTEWKTVAQNKQNIRMIKDTYSEDGGMTADMLERPRSLSSKRICIKYSDQGRS